MTEKTGNFLKKISILGDFGPLVAVKDITLLKKFSIVLKLI